MSEQPTTVSGEFEVERNFWCGSGCAGSVSFRRLDPPEPGWSAMYGVSPEELIGRYLGAGARIRVTVEVLEDVPITECLQAGRQDLHDAHRPGPDLIAADGTRWRWSAPDGVVGGTRVLVHERWNRPGETYRESSYSAGYRQLDQGPDINPLRRVQIESRHGKVTEVADATVPA